MTDQAASGDHAAKMLDQSMKIANIENEGNVTKEFIYNEIMEIYNKYRRANIPLNDTTALTKFRDVVFDKHKKLYEAYPLILRHMIDDGMFSPKALERYLTFLDKNPWRTESEQEESYAKYYLLTIKQLQPNLPKTQYTAIYNDYLNNLRKENKLMKELYEIKKEKVKLEIEKHSRERKEEALNKFTTMSEKMNFSPETLEMIKLKLTLGGENTLPFLEAICDTLLRNETNLPMESDPAHKSVVDNSSVSAIIDNVDIPAENLFDDLKK